MSLNKIFHNPAPKPSNHHDNKQQEASERWCMGPSLIFSIFFFFPVIWDRGDFSSLLLNFRAQLRFTDESYLLGCSGVITFLSTGCHIVVISALSQDLLLVMYQNDQMPYKSFRINKLKSQKSFNLIKDFLDQKKSNCDKGSGYTHTHQHSSKCLYTVIG